MSEELENVVAVISCAALGTVGILANGICSILLLQIKTYKTAFGYLTLFHSSANAILISSYLFWVAPYILWNFRELLIVNRTVGQITMIAQAASYSSLLLLSVNRLICTYKPMRYSVLFTNRNTFFYISVMALICITYGCVYFHTSCYHIFDRSSLEFRFSPTACGQFLSDFIDFWTSIVVLAFAGCLDLLTLAKLRLLRGDYAEEAQEMHRCLAHNQQSLQQGGESHGGSNHYHQPRNE
ncbi:hypothetical protein KIN20_018700 [Parelaphostrongylus tenuis]|uniref:7TM GPCR serpentine receptor class x (Srx) domain-containing protein n=1 Tax=Parelaphostrongylus tenuis TaxID=148309 RepID=A0AAD5N7U3_PARTN|nr:hypothetical protein KIN20_018700 [Parelaphostrongylus tenuis]